MNDNKIKICNGVYFTSICDNRFKNARLSVNMILPLDEEKASLNAILPMVLRRSCEKYKDFQSLNRILSELYGAGIFADVKKIGEAQVFGLSALFNDERYIPNNEKLSLKVADLLCEMIFRPNIDQKGFNEVDVEQEKRQLVETLNAEFNDKRQYAMKRCEEVMCQDERFSVNTFGKIEKVKDITAKKLFKHWQYVLENAQIEIIMLGSADNIAIQNKFLEEFKNIDRQTPQEITTEIIKECSEVKRVGECFDVKQAKLVMGFRSPRSVKDTNIMATRMMSALFGGTPHSKLFTVVREKMSLCYYCSSVHFRNKGVMFVQSGVEEENIEKAEIAILEQLKAIQNGEITDKELNATKLSMINALNSFTDSIGALENWCIAQIFEPYKKSIEENIREVKAITKEDITKAAKEITLDTVYVLSSREEGINCDKDCK